MTGSPPLFDLTRADGRVLVVPTESVVDLLEVTHAPERVEAYRQAFLRGDRFPPVAVVRILGWHVLADGHKRLLAYRSLGHAEVPVVVWTFSRWTRDQLRQLADNGRKNAQILRLAVTDRRRARVLLLSTVGHWRRVVSSLARRLRRGTAASG